MGISILDPHPNNECVDIGARDVWFSFIFCGSHIDKLNMHVYDYYSGQEVITEKGVVYQDVPALDHKLNVWNGVGNGVRVNIRDFVKDATSVFKSAGEYTWRAELVQEVDIDNGLYPDNMIYEGVLPGEPNFYATVDNISGLDYDHYLPLTPCYEDKIKPPYYVDFLDPKFENTAYDIPVTFDKTQLKSNGEHDTVIQLDTYTSTAKSSKDVLRPAVGTQVYVHKKKYFGELTALSTNDKDEIFIDSNIPSINANDYDNTVDKECYYLKVGNEYFVIQSYDKTLGIIKCKDGSKLKEYPVGTHYAIYTSRFWTPYYYFRAHVAPTVTVKAEFHERRRLDSKVYDTITNCLENTTNGILFKAKLTGDSHSAVKYHYWDIINADTGKIVYKTEKVYSQEMDCEVFVPFGHRYIGKITVVTQDGITVRGESKEFDLPLPPDENNKRFSLKAYQNKFGGVELAWNYNFFYDGGSFFRATDFEVFRIDKRINKVKYLGKVDCSPVGIEGITPAASGGNWYLIDKDCDFKLKTPKDAKVNMYLVGGGCDGGGWTVTPNSTNKSFAVGQDGGEGGCFIKKSVTSTNGVLQCQARVAPRNNTTGTSLKIGGNTYKCNDSGYQKRGKVSNNTMVQEAGGSVIYNDNAENGENGFSTPYGVVASSGGGGASCGGNRTNGGAKTLSISGVTPKYNKGNWILIDRDSLGGESGEFDLTIPEGAVVRTYLVGGGRDGGYFRQAKRDELINSYKWDVNASMYEKGGGGGYVLSKDLSVSGTVHFNVNIANVNDVDGTNITFDGKTYNCSDKDSKKTKDTQAAHAEENEDGTKSYYNAEKGVNGVETPYGYVGSSGGGGASNNGIRSMNGAKGGIGAGDGGMPNGNSRPTGGTNATKYGCGGGGGALRIYSYSVEGDVDRTNPGKGMPGCIIFEILQIDVPCPDPGKGGVGAGDGGFPGDDGESATRYGCGGGGAGYHAVDSDGNYTVGNVGKGMQGCIILEIDLDGLEGGTPEQVYAVDWTAASDKEYQYIVTGCNYESAYLGKDSEGNDIRHLKEDMIECTASVDITPHFQDFYIYFLNDADIPIKSELNYESYDTPLIEPLGRYVTSRNNPYKAIKRHMHALALERDSKAFYRRHTWRIEGDVEIGEVTHNITRNVNPLYAKMPSVTVEPTDYDNFSLSFLFGYLDCCACEDGDFVFDDQYMFELWKKCVYEKQTVMIKDPKGNVWTGTLTSHNYQVEYDTNGMPYILTVDFTQTRTEDNTLVMIVDDHNEYLKTVKNNHLR